VKVLFIAPEVRVDSVPYHFPFWSAILGAIVEKKGGQVAVLDLNAIRMNYPKNQISNQIIQDEISREQWDLIGIGGLTSTYKRIKELSRVIKNTNPNAILIGGGGWSTYNPDEILKLVPEIDLICIGEGEETFSEVYDEIENGSKDFGRVDGLCIKDENGIRFTGPRALISDLNTVPFPDYELFEMEVYFRYSSLPLSVESFNAKRRASVVWERGCPRGCTFCSHNGMSRIDLQNIYGKGDRIEGEKMVRISDKKSNTFQLPARWPDPEYAIKNIEILKENYNIDFVSILDENMTSNRKWTEKFCELYLDSGLTETVKWGTLGDAPSVAVAPDLVKTMKKAGCCYISFGFESASDKVLNQDIKKGQLQIHEQKTIDAVKAAGLTPLATFMIGNAHEDINDILETVAFWIKNNIEVDPFICTPYIGSPIFFDNKESILQEYDDRLKIINEKKELGENISKETIENWKLSALDKFMGECGDATEYTATVSQYFTLPELVAIKQFMKKKDVRRLMKMAQQRYKQTGLTQWKLSDKWKKYSPYYKSLNELSVKMEVPYK